MVTGLIELLTLILSVLLYIPAYATVPVKAISGQPVSVCTPSDSNSNCGGSGTVSSVGLSTPNSTLSLGGTNPVTGTGTISADINLSHANTWTGQQTFSTSAPIVSTATASTPAAFDTLKRLVSGTYSGSSTKVATSSGTLTSGDCVKIDSTENYVDAGNTCGVGSIFTGTTNHEAVYTGSTSIASGSISDSGNGVTTANNTLDDSSGNMQTYGSVTVNTAYSGGRIFIASSPAGPDAMDILISSDFTTNYVLINGGTGSNTTLDVDGSVNLSGQLSLGGGAVLSEWGSLAGFGFDPSNAPGGASNNFYITSTGASVGTNAPSTGFQVGAEQTSHSGFTACIGTSNCLGYCHGVINPTTGACATCSCLPA